MLKRHTGTHRNNNRRILCAAVFVSGRTQEQKHTHANVNPSVSVGRMCGAMWADSSDNRDVALMPRRVERLGRPHSNKQDKQDRDGESGEEQGGTEREEGAGSGRLHFFLISDAHLKQVKWTRVRPALYPIHVKMNVNILVTLQWLTSELHCVLTPSFTSPYMLTFSYSLPTPSSYLF